MLLLLSIILSWLSHPTFAASPGLAWPNQLYVPMAGFTGPGTAISSYYTWSPSPVIKPKSYPSIYAVPFDFIPMLWGCLDDNVDAFNAALNSSFQGVNLTLTKDILAFNEPDLAAQANCPPAKAAQVWKNILEPLKSKGYRLGSPAVTGGSGGKKWMQDWFEACQGGCNPDFVAVHWYDIDSGDFIQHLQDFYWSFGKPIWVTEYAVMNVTTVGVNTKTHASQRTLTQIEVFMDVTRSFMESVDWVERYFYFGAMYDMQGVNPLNTLFDVSGRQGRTGALNALGVQYARSNGSVDPNAVIAESAAKLRVRLGASMVLGLLCCILALH